MAFPRLTCNTAQQIEYLILIMLVRALHARVGSYGDPRIPKEWSSAAVVVGWMGTAESAAMQVIDICRVLKLNVFALDATTRLIEKSLIGVSKMHQQMNAYLLSRCSSRTFARAFHDSGAYCSRNTIFRKLGRTLSFLRHRHWVAFTCSFSSQALLRRKHFKLRRHPRKAKRMFFKEFPARLDTLNLKDSSGKWRSKFDVCKEIRSWRGMGPFTAKNFWQYLSLGRWMQGYPSRYNLEFGEVGPGGRTGVNYMLGYPAMFCKMHSDDPAALFYADAVDESTILKHS